MCVIHDDNAGVPFIPTANYPRNNSMTPAS